MITTLRKAVARSRSGANPRGTTFPAAAALGRAAARSCAGAGLALWMILGVPCAAPAAAQEVPRYELDPLWPRLPLGGRWLTGGLGGMCVGGGDRIFILNRGNVVPEDLDGARPARLGGRLHDCHVGADGALWIVAAGTGVVRKYPADGGEPLLQIGETGQYDSSDGTRQGRRIQKFVPAAP